MTITPGDGADQQPIPPIPPAPGAYPPPPGSSLVPAVPAAQVVPQDITTYDAAPAGEPKRRRGPAIAIAAAVGVLVLGGGATAGTLFVLNKDDSTASGGGYAGPDQDVVMLTEYEDGEFGDTLITTFGSEDDPIAIDGGEFWPAQVIAQGLSTSVADVGGPFVGTLSDWDDGEYLVVAIDPETGETTELLDLDADPSVSFDPASGTVLAQEPTDDGTKCYAGTVEDGLERIASADYCWLVTDAGAIVAVDYDDDYVTSEATVMSLDGEELFSEDVVARPLVLVGGDAVAYVRGEEGDVELAIADLASGDELVSESIGASAEVLDVTSDAVLVASADEEGEITLASYGLDGSSVEIATMEGRVQGSFVGGSTYVAFTSVDDDEEVLNIATIDGDEVDVEELASDDVVAGIQATVDGTPFFMSLTNSDEDSSIVFWSPDFTTDVSFKGEVYDGYDELVLLDDVAFVNWSGYTDDGVSTSHAVIVDLASGEVTEVGDDDQLVEFQDVRNDGSALVASADAIDTEETTLSYLDPEGELIELDDDYYIYGASFSKDGKQAVYQAFGSSDSSDAEVRVVDIDGEGDVETLWKDVRLISLGWRGIDNWARLTYYSTYFEASTVGRACEENFSYEVLEPGAYVSNSTEGDGMSYCLEISEAGDYSIEVYGYGSDTFMDIDGVYDADGGYSGEVWDYSDDTDTVDPALYLYLEPGAYVVRVAPYDYSDYVSFDLTVSS